MSILLYSNTSAVTVLDNCGLTVRDIAYHRHPDTPGVTNERITRHRYNSRGFLTQSADPRLHDAGLANFSYLNDLTGRVLRTLSVDAGTTIGLNDAAGRPFIAVSNISTADNGTEDRSQAMARTWQYEDAELPGRPVRVTEQVTGQAARIAERFIWAGPSDAEKLLNHAGACVSNYDTAGLTQTESIALTGVPLSVTRRLLKDADNLETVVDWHGKDVSAWNNQLETEAYTTLATADATGAVLTTTDAEGHMQRVAYEVAGLLAGSWLTLKGGSGRVIVKSLRYSAAGQKLREEHGNGVVTAFTYEAQTQRLTGIKTERPARHASGAKVLQDLRYEYDPVGNALKVSNGAEETRFWRNQKVVPENTYAYDSLYQLVRATGREIATGDQQGSSLPSAAIPLPTVSAAYANYTRTYHYDNANNLTQITHSAPATNNSYTTKITISDRSNRGVLSTLTENSAEVDALFTAGGQQKQLLAGQSLVWTPRNELLQVKPVVRDGDKDDRESYRYDGGSQRVLKISFQKTGSSAQTQRVLYLQGLELRSTKSGSTETESLQVITVGEAGQAQVRVLHWESGRPAETGNDQIRYSYDSLTGSSGLELDGDGKVISTEEYYPYGGTAVWTARSAVETDYKVIRYSGKERDATGLYYYGYRYYQPWAGRWLSADPAGTIDGLNLFKMCRNNPVSHTDHDGRMTDREEYTYFQIELAAAMLGIDASDIGAPDDLLASLSDSPSSVNTVYEEDAPVTDADRQPYLDLELKYNDLFNDNYIVNVPESQVLTLNNVIDVDMDEMQVINYSQARVYLGTTGLGPCIAIGGLGYTPDNQVVLGLTHFTGVEGPAVVMSRLDDAMRKAGSVDIGYIMVGGNISPGGEEGGSLVAERELLSLRDSYRILSVRLHTSEGETDPITGESTAVDAVLTPTHMLFRKAALY